MTPIVKYAFAVGGTALGSFVVGLLLFDTIRAAASVPIVVLFIGTATFPAPLVELASIRPTLITWMGVIIGATALAEGANQIAGSFQKTQLAKAMVNAAGADALTTPERVNEAVNKVVVAESGDLGAARR